MNAFSEDTIAAISTPVAAGGIGMVRISGPQALEVADRAYVLETGKIVLSGNANELMNNDSVKKAYLGE